MNVNVNSSSPFACQKVIRHLDHGSRHQKVAAAEDNVKEEATTVPNVEAEGAALVPFLTSCVLISDWSFLSDF